MKKGTILIAALALVFATSCKSDKKETKVADTPTPPPTEQKAEPVVKKVKVALEAKSDSGVSGNAVFTEENGTVTMVAVFEGLTPGVHAIHLHEKADCSSPDGKSTGGHWNPTAQNHGKWGDTAGGYHKGDIGNFTADENGNGTITFTTDEWCIGCGDVNKNIIGKGIIVHQGEDDFKTQPTGDAGGRVSCGGIIE
ncbi:superoxide dismutase family protein [Formosa haliotis]|uniref:superoxide dismutase family protein n=1 Tax=Formosa haliotis TaxID=1555194 RepID=UPI000825E7B1|nr:superoxide dismutase family protein [Formosa haliotis]